MLLGLGSTMGFRVTTEARYIIPNFSMCKIYGEHWNYIKALKLIMQLIPIVTTVSWQQKREHIIILKIIAIRYIRLNMGGEKRHSNFVAPKFIFNAFKRIDFKRARCHVAEASRPSLAHEKTSRNVRLSVPNRYKWVLPTPLLGNICYIRWWMCSQVMLRSIVGKEAVCFLCGQPHTTICEEED